MSLAVALVKPTLEEILDALWAKKLKCSFCRKILPLDASTAMPPEGNLRKERKAGRPINRRATPEITPGMTKECTGCNKQLTFDNYASKPTAKIVAALKLLKRRQKVTPNNALYAWKNCYWKIEKY